jgi:hypothetical protein
MRPEKLRTARSGSRLRPVRRLAAASWATLALASAAVRGEEIRIEVARGREFSRLDAPGAVFSADGAPADVRGTSHELRARAGALLVDGTRRATPFAVKPGAGGLRLDGKELPGRLEVWADGSGLVLVNALDL